jgi:hypothetical protein|tara:strand:- start:660 stop:797 length:138 start_codon:yes stop_codon:yes gene_type:complete
MFEGILIENDLTAGTVKEPVFKTIEEDLGLQLCKNNQVELSQSTR